MCDGFQEGLGSTASGLALYQKTVNMQGGVQVPLPESAWMLASTIACTCHREP